MITRGTSAVLVGILMAWAVCQAEVPGVLNHQGRLTVNGTNYTGLGQFKFALVSRAGDRTFWSHDGSSFAGTEPTGTPIFLEVTRGVFSVNLGDVTVPNMLQSIPGDVFTNAAVYLRVWVSDGTNSFQRLAPDRRVGAAGYALTAGNFLGAVSEQQLPGNVALLDKNLSFAGTVTFAGPALLNNPANQITGNFSGDGSGLTRLNSSQLIGSLSPAMVESALPPGIMLASMSAQDSSLLSRGYRLAMTIPAPPWVNGATATSPSARRGHTAVWDGSHFIVWGGALANGTALDSGALWSPDSDSWTEISNLSAPVARAEHSAVWDGTEMLVWGGKGAAGYLRTGARFNAQTQVWTPIATANAPTARSGHVAVWTGNRMLIWGGQNDSGLLNDGAVYDPSANLWTPLALPNAPAARVGATAIWAGDRVVIWGGQSSSGAAQTGAQLLFSSTGSPANWVATTLGSAPGARRWHSAIWTGARMIVWGGELNGVPLNDGASYAPTANTWEPLTLTQAPAARHHHAAMWTGDEMLIVGGSTGAAEFAGGSAYNPTTRTWRSLSTSGNPQSRTEGAAAWTGTELLLFGGVSASQPLSALQRLNPQPVWYFYRKL